MERDPRQSIHEIGLATKLSFSSVRPAVVTVRSAAQPGPSSLGRVREECGLGDGDNQEPGDNRGQRDNRGLDNNRDHGDGQGHGKNQIHGDNHSHGDDQGHGDGDDGDDEADGDRQALGNYQEHGNNQGQHDQTEGESASSSHLDPELSPDSDATLRPKKRLVDATHQGADEDKSNPAPEEEDADEDAWSTYANPTCGCEPSCDHTTRLDVVLFAGAQEGDRPVQNHDQLGQDHDRLSTTNSAISSSQPSQQPPNLDSTNLQTQQRMRDQTNAELPSSIGPFRLTLLSSASIAGTEDQISPRATPSTNEEKVFTDEMEYHPTSRPGRRARLPYTDGPQDRTAEWVRSLVPEAEGAPEPAPILGFTDDSFPANPDNMGASRRDRRQEPPGLRGNFIPLSRTSQGRPSSPQRDPGSTSVRLQFSLTDSQMGQLAAALSSDDGNEPPLPRGRAQRVDHDASITGRAGQETTAPRMRSRSPTKTYQSGGAPTRARSRSPVKFESETPATRRAPQGAYVNPASAPSGMARGGYLARDPFTTHGTPTPGNGRGLRGPPAPIDTHLAQAHGRMAAMRLGQPAVVVHNPPDRVPSPFRQSNKFPTADESSSFYSQESIAERFPSCISPLLIQKYTEPKHLSILQAYADEKSANESEKESRGQDHRGTADEASSGPDLAYTPLAPFLRQGPTVRKASKTLIGEGGWLENTSKIEQTTSPTRGGGLLSSLVKKAKEMIEANQDSRAQRKSRDSDKGPVTKRQLAISLSPREQSLLYCELEFVLATALNDYITVQFSAGRLDADRLRKVAEDWQRKGRPRVVCFRYDLETQLDLVRMHVHDFQFRATAAGATASTTTTSTTNPTTATAAILGVIDTAKANARVVRVRTFCQPDTVIAKQLLDAQGLFAILGCPEDQQIKLAEIIAFFKAAVERRQLQQQGAGGVAGGAAGGGVAGGPAGGVPPAVPAQAMTSPVRGGRSPTRQAAQGWSHAGRMDPAGYQQE